MFLLSFLFLSCSQTNTLQVDMEKTDLLKVIGDPDSVQIKEGIPDVYTNKLINIEQWFYGTDTVINIANDKVQNIIIQPK